MHPMSGLLYHVFHGWVKRSYSFSCVFTSPTNFGYNVCILALLQEEVIGPSKKEVRKWDSMPTAKPYVKSALPLLLPPNHTNKLIDAAPGKPSSDGPHGPSADDSWAALRSYRRSQGLCVHCAGKWSKDHQSP